VSREHPTGANLQNCSNIFYQKLLSGGNNGKEKGLKGKKNCRHCIIVARRPALRRDWTREMLKKLDKEKAELAHSCGAFVQSKREEIKQISIKLQRLLDSYLDQDVDRDSYLAKKHELLSQKKTLEEQISRFSESHHAWLEPMREWTIEAA
jgi:hypothetical protein